MTSKLLLGCGEWDWPDYFKIDASPKSNANIIQAFPPLPISVKARQWSEILCVHTIEHLTPWDALTLASECYAILEPGGKLILEQPNILYAAGVLTGEIVPPQGEIGQYDLWPLYGDPTTKDPLMLHHWGYSPQSMVQMLIQAGFEAEKMTVLPAIYHRPVRDFRVEAVK